MNEKEQCSEDDFKIQIFVTECDCMKGNLQLFKGLQAFNIYSQAGTDIILQARGVAVKYCK
jgi:hypothetical protein